MAVRLHPRWLLTAWTSALLLFLYLPIVVLVIYSFNASRLNITWQGFTFRWYRELLHDPPLLNALENSLIVASVTTVLAVLLGTSAAWGLFRYRVPLRTSIEAMLALPIVVPDVIMGVSLLIFFATLSAAGNRFAAAIGGSGNTFGLGLTTVTLAHVTFCFPFVMITVRARLAGIDPALEEAALDLGATPWQALVHVIIPFLLPGIISGALMAFTLSLDELIVTYFTYGPGAETLPIKVYGMARVGMSPSLNAISTTLIVATALLMCIADLFRRLRR